VHLITFFFRLSPLRMTLAIVAGALSGLTNVLFIAVLAQVLRDNSSGSVAWKFFGLCAAMLVGRLVSERALIHLSQNTVYELRMQLCRQIIKVPLRDVETLGSHKLLATLTDDVNTLTNAGMAIPAFCTSLAIVTGCLAYCLTLSPVVFGAVIIVVSLGIVTYKLIARTAAMYLKLAREGQDTLMAHFRTLINGGKELRLHLPRRLRLLSALEVTGRTLHRYSRQATFRYAWAGTGSATLYFLLIAVLVFVLPNQLGAAKGSILTGAVLALLAMRGSVETLVGFTPHLMRAEVALKKIERLGTSLAKLIVVEPPPPNLPQPAFASIDWSGVTYSYVRDDGTSFTLGPIDLQLRAGELVIVSGGNGSGKTTMGKLLTALYLPDAGDVRLNGVTVSDANRELFRSYFSAVFSDYHLEAELPPPHGPELDRRATAILATLQLDAKVRVEQGRISDIDLSQGQRKRLALLVALLEDRPVYLFDEWAADQDSTFRRLFYHDILPDLKARGKTLVVISHDEQYYDVADRVIYLNEGRIRPVRPSAIAPRPRATALVDVLSDTAPQHAR